MYNDLMPQNIEQLITSAENGDPEAQYKLGAAYYFGRMGVKQDYALAADWYSKSAEQGHLKAAYYLGTMYQNAQGVPQNYEEAAEWFKLAINPNDNKPQLALSFLYRNGLGVEKNDSIADEFSAQAERFDKIKALMSSGIKYTQGRGDSKDYARAMECFRGACDMGEVKAPYYIGMMYYEGLGVEKDFRKAVEWLKTAESLGDVRAARILKWLPETSEAPETSGEETLTPETPPDEPSSEEPIESETLSVEPLDSETPSAEPLEPESLSAELNEPETVSTEQPETETSLSEAPESESSSTETLPPEEPSEPPAYSSSLTKTLIPEIPQDMPLIETPLTETKDEPVTHKRKERSTNGLMLKVFLLVIAAVVIVMLGLYIRGRLSKRLNADKNLSSVNPVSYDVKYYTEGIPNIGGLSRDIPDYVMTTGKLICDSRYADGIADVTERNVKLYAQPDEKLGGIANNTGIMRFFEASTNRVRSSRRIAEDLMQRYNDLIRIRGTWQQAKDNGYSEGVWGKYRREEENLLNKLNTAMETVSHEADKAREKMKMNMKTPQTLTYLGEWISPKGKRWIITRSTGSTENRIFWVEAVNVKLMTADEYHNECEKCMKKIDEAEKYSDVKTLSIDVPPMNLMSERTMLPLANPPNLRD